MKRLSLLLAFGLASVSAHPAAANETDGDTTVEVQPSGWAANRLTLIRKGKKLDRGLALYTSDEEAPGVAFRCHRQKLYAFVSVKPVSFKSLLTERFRNPAEWQVEYRIDGDEPTTESWVWTYNGKVFMSRPGASAETLFRASLHGASIEFTRKHGEPVMIDLPPAAEGLFDQFLRLCELDPMKQAPGSS